MNKRPYIWMIFSFIFLLNSCIKEDLGNCPTGKFLYFKTKSPKYKYEEIVESVDIYLYDEAERLVQQFSYSKENLKANNYKAFIPYQQDGEYTVIALINQTDHYESVHTRHLGELKTRIITENGDSITFKPDDIYHSYKEIKFGNTYRNIDTLTLSKNTNHIELEVEVHGYDLPENAMIRTHISGRNGVYNYNNKAIAGPELIYIPHTHWNRNSDNKITINNLSTILRLWIDDDLIVRIEEHIENEVPKELTNLMLTKMISSLKDPNTGEKLYDTNEKLELEDEYKIKVVLDSSLGIVEIKINDWYYINPGVDL